MIIVHTDSGLGNQMLDYVEYLAIKNSNPDKECLLEDILYYLPDDRPGMFSKWNGYELNKVFGINVPMLRDKLPSSVWQNMVMRMDESRFWESGWDYRTPLCEALKSEAGLIITDPDSGKPVTSAVGVNSNQSAPRKLLTSFFQTRSGYHVKRIIKHAETDRLVMLENAKLNPFREYEDNVLTGHSLAFKYKGFGIENLDKEIREAFVFPEITDDKNKEALFEIQNSNAVAIHARRSDMLFVNGYCYKYGYFMRAVRFIKNHVDNPVFYFFTDNKSVDWCHDNGDIFGLDFTKDNVRFIDWNKGKDSYRDMQLMAACHHNIFTESSFGFWGAYLNEHKDKITCAPDPTILATNDF